MRGSEKGEGMGGNGRVGQGTEDEKWPVGNGRRADAAGSGKAKEGVAAGPGKVKAGGYEWQDGGGMDTIVP